MANRGNGGGGRDAPRYADDDRDDDRRGSATPPSYRRDSPPRDRVGRYRGGGGSNARSQDGPTGVNLNVEQMISMVFEMRGTLAHEVEARKSLEAQLYEARGSIEALRDNGSRDNNKWSNLLARVKELEVGSKLDTRLLDLNNRADKFSRNADQTKIVGVFQDMKARMDAQERDYRESINRLGREQMRDASRLDSEMKNYIDAQLGKMEQRLSGDIDGLARLSGRVVELEKEFSVFLNTQMSLQLSMQNKEKDGDWLKIYLTENFQAQKAATEIKFTEVQATLERLDDKARNIEEKARSDLGRTTHELTDALAEERVSRDASVKKLQKSLKLSFTNLGESLKSMCGGLDSKIDRTKATQNEAISSLHRLQLEADARFTTHQQAFEDMVALQSSQTSSTHTLSARVDGLEEVLKAEIKSRIKNYQKTKSQGMELAKGFEARIEGLKAFLVQEAELKAKADAALRAEEEEHARLLHLAMETRSVLDSMVGQVEEQHYVELRRNEWKAFGQVIELELSSRDAEMERKLATLGDPNSGVGQQVDELKSYVSEAFREFEAHEKMLKAEEEEQAALMHIAMETRSVLDSLVDHIVDVADARVLATLDANVRSLHHTSAASEDQIHALKNLMEAGHDSTAAQLAATHTEIMKMATDLAAQIDSHSSHLEQLDSTTTAQGKTLIAIKSQVEESADLQVSQTRDLQATKSGLNDVRDAQETLTRDLKTQKSHMLDVQDTLATQASAVKILQSSLSDQSLQSHHQRQELEQKLHSKVSEATSALSSSSIRIDEMTQVLKRIEGHDRAHTEMSASIDQLSLKQSKLDAGLIGMQDRLDEAAMASDRKLKDLRDKLEQDNEEQEVALKKVDKKLHAHMEEFAGLAGDFAARSGGLSTASKTTEEQVMELRSKLSTLSTIPVQLDALKSDMKEVHGRLDGALSAERHARDIKDLQSALHDAADVQAKDTKVLRDSLHSMEEATTKREKSMQDHLHELDQKVRAGTGAGKDDPKQGSAAASKQVDASLVEREVSRVQENVDALSRKLKDQSNFQEDALNRVSQDLKKLGIKVESIESSGGAGGGPAGNGAAKAGSNSSGADASDLSLRVDQLESELKLKTLPALALQVETLASKSESRAKETESKFAAHDARFERLDADIKSAVAASDDVDAKQNKRVRELQAAIETQSARDMEAVNQIKSDAANRALEVDLLLKASESRSHAELKLLQKQLDGVEVDLKSHSRAVDDKLHDMAWSLEYAKDEMFKKDAKEIRQGAAPPPPQHPKPQPAPQQQQPTGHHAAAPSSSENYEDDEKSQKDSQR